MDKKHENVHKRTIVKLLTIVGALTRIVKYNHKIDYRKWNIWNYCQNALSHIPKIGEEKEKTTMFGIYDIFKWHGIRSPHKTALICGENRYTYGQLNRRINCVAYGLHEMGVKKGSRVGLMLYNGVDFVTAFFAGIKLGACVIPFDYRWYTEELLQELTVVNCDYFLFEEELLDKVKTMYPDEKYHIQLVTNKESCFPSFVDFLDNGFDHWNYDEDLAPDDVIFTIFTGGTTGLPKAAMHTQQGTLIRCLGLVSNTRLADQNDVYLSYAPMFHLGGIGAMLEMFTYGGTLCLTSGFDPDEIISTVERERVTQLTLIPPTIINRLKDARDDGADISCIKKLRLAGGSCTDATLELAFELFPDVLCINAYGHSENALYMTHVFNKEDYYADRSTVLLLGKPELYFEAKIVDENGNRVPVGQAGEVYGRSPAMMKGFMGMASPFTEDGWYPTGDLMYQDETGNFHFCSRSKDMVKSGGENVYADEVESAITRDNPGVAECAVVGLPDEEWGEIVTAAVVLAPGAELSEEDIIEHCRRYIASYKKPKKVFFLDELPRSSVGKVTKAVLKQQLMSL